MVGDGHVPCSMGYGSGTDHLLLDHLHHAHVHADVPEASCQSQGIELAGEGICTTLNLHSAH